jgi:hypothetical protein
MIDYMLGPYRIVEKLGEGGPPSFASRSLANFGAARETNRRTR